MWCRGGGALLVENCQLGQVNAGATRKLEGWQQRHLAIVNHRFVQVVKTAGINLQPVLGWINDTQLTEISWIVNTLHYGTFYDVGPQFQHSIVTLHFGKLLGVGHQLDLQHCTVIKFGGGGELWMIEVDLLIICWLAFLVARIWSRNSFVGSSPCDINWTLWSDQSNFRRKFDVLIIKGGVHW